MKARFVSKLLRKSVAAVATVALLAMMLAAAIPAVYAAAPNSKILADFDRKPALDVATQHSSIATIVPNPNGTMGNAVMWESDHSSATPNKIIPCFTGGGRTDDTAIAFWMQVGSTSPWLTLHIYEGEEGAEGGYNDSFGMNPAGAVYYTITEDGLRTNSVDGTTFRLPVEFSGWVVIPYSSLTNRWTDGDNGVLDPDSVTGVDLFYDDGFHHADPIYLDQFTTLRDVNEFALYVNGGDITKAAQFVVDFDDNMYTSKDAGTAGWTEGEGYGLSGNGLKWEPSVSVTRINFAPTRNAAEEAFVFWMSGEEIPWASPREIQMYLHDIDGNRCLHLPVGATYYRLSDEGEKETVTVSNNKFIQLENGFSGWYIIPLSSLEVTWGPDLTSRPFEGSFCNVQLYNEWPAPNTIYLDNLGFTGDIDFFMQVGAYNGPVCDSVEVPVTYVADFDETTYVSKNGSTWSEQASVSYAGNAAKWEANVDGVTLTLNGSGDAADEAFVFWLSGEEIPWASPREIQTLLFDIDGNRCFHLPSGATYYRISDEGVKETKTVNTNQRIELENGFAGWYVIPLANMTLTWGPDPASRPMECGGIDQVKFYNDWPAPTTFYIDNIGFSNDMDGFMAAAEAGTIGLAGTAEHIWLEATCQYAKTCEYCGAVEGTTVDHSYEDGKCEWCGEEDPNACNHQYMFPCDAHCMICGELTNPDAAHTIVHVDGVEATCTENGNIEYWYCSDCGAAWSDEALTKVTNRMSIVTYTDHVYENGACKWCAEADPDAPVVDENLVASATKGTLTFNVYAMDGGYKLVVNGTGTIDAWTGLAIYNTYAADIKALVIGEGITEVGSSAFANLAALESVEFSSTVAKLSYGAFMKTGLKEIVIPDTIKVMGNWVFANCKSLVSAKMGNGLTNKTLSARTFSGCSALKEIDFGTKIRLIDDYAFNQCGLENLYLPANIKTVDNAAFYKSALKTVEIADGGVTYLGWASFYACSNLESVDLGDSLTNISTWVFTACNSLKEITIPASVTSIGRCTFKWCKALETVVLSDAMTEIKDEMFYGCTVLKNVTLPANLTAIGAKAFYNCKALTSIVIPEGADVAADAFKYSGVK